MTFPRLKLVILLALLGTGSVTARAQTPPNDPPAGPVAPSQAAPPAETAPEDEDDEETEIVLPSGDLFELGQTLFETFAPEEIKERYRFPTREEWDEFAARLDRALQSPSLRELAEMEPDARAALVALRALPDYAEYAEWLEDRLDDIAVAHAAETSPSPTPSAPVAPVAPSTPSTPSPPEITFPDPAAPGPDETPAVAAAPAVPLYDLWLERMQKRPAPSRAASLVPRLKPAFHEADVPAALVWLAETESSFNPAARSPVGARGLFQLMPATAKDLGLRLFPFDERLDPLKSAQSAARYLSRLHGRFRDWPLALAAYNAGPSRVSRILKERDAKTFAEIAEALPSETRLYVPKVLATIAVREGVRLDQLPGPSIASVAPRAR